MSKKKICIVGGGSAGYLAALYLLEKNPTFQIHLIESSKLPVIGVGEATTTPVIEFLHRSLNISINEFFKETKPTIKLGIRFHWGKVGPDYYYNDPFGKINPLQALYFEKNINANSLSSRLMDANKVPFYKSEEGLKMYQIPNSFAYHVDNKRFLDFLKRKFIERGGSYHDLELKDKVFSEDGSVKGLITSEGQQMDFDFFVDCSGFRSFLIDGMPGNAFESYTNSLFTNRAVIGIKDHGGNPKVYTTAKTIENGWIWSTPTQFEDHLGYVYCSDFCSDDKAMHDLSLQVDQVREGRILKFTPGRKKFFWIKNVASVDNSTAFVEPLESSGIHMIIYQIKKISKGLNAYQDPKVVAQANEDVGKAWDFIKRFIALHYKINHHNKSAFWEYARSETVTELDDYFNFFTKNGPIDFYKGHAIYEELNKDGVFGTYSFDVLMLGAGVPFEMQDQVKKQLNSNWNITAALEQARVKRAISATEFYGLVEEGSIDFTQLFTGFVHK